MAQNLRIACFGNDSSFFTAELRSVPLRELIASGSSPSHVKQWKEALLIFKPETFLCWHRQGFRLFRRFQLDHQSGRPNWTSRLSPLFGQRDVKNRLRGLCAFIDLLIRGTPVTQHTIQINVACVRATPRAQQTWGIILQSNIKDIWACDCLPVIDRALHPLDLFFASELRSRRVVPLESKAFSHSGG